MSDLISRSKAIECVENIIEIADKEDKKTVTGRILTSLYFQPIALRWIPVKEKLPENTDYVLITTQYGVILMAFRGMSGKWCYLNGKRMDPQDIPMAWMPLPEPYEEAME